MEESDPAKSNALESSLWEIKSLQNHYYHSIAKKSNQASHSMQPRETPLEDLLEIKCSEVSFQRWLCSNMNFGIILLSSL